MHNSPVTQFLGNRTGEGKFEAAMFLYKDREYRKAYSLSPVLDENSRSAITFVFVSDYLTRFIVT